jgi:hypothetical protein
MHIFTAARWLPHAAIVLLFSGFASSQAPVPVQLTLDDATPTNGRVHFRQGSCDLQPAPLPANLQQMIQATTDAHTVFADMSKTSPLYGSFIYEFYVARQGATPSVPMCSFRVLENPTGSFLDQLADVSFHVKDGAASEDGTIRIPVYNSSYQSVLQVDPANPFATVSLSGSSPVNVKLTNLLELPVSIDDITAQADHPNYWQVAPKAVFQSSPPGGTTLQPKQMLDNGIEIIVVPNSWHALGASIFPLARDKEQETVHLNVNFHTPGGVLGTIEKTVPLRLKPSFWNLALAVCIGALIGSGLALLLPKKPSGDSLAWWKAMLIALGFGIVAEALAIILIEGNSEFRLFSFELDPYQLMQASLIGALVGLKGFRSADDFLNLFKKDKNKP